MSRDHVPPKVLFPTSLRPGLQLLRKLPAHRECNGSFSDDEEYFRAKILMMSERTEGAEAQLRDFLDSVPKSLSLAKRLAGDLTNTTPAGLTLPAGVIGMNYDGTRTDRVVWKIARGLAFRHYGELLPSAPKPSATIGLLQGPQFLRLLKGHEYFQHVRKVVVSREAFSYAYGTERGEGAHLTVFFLEFLSAVVGYAIFHNTDCECPSCADRTK